MIPDLELLISHTGMSVVAFNYPKVVRSAQQVIDIGSDLVEHYLKRIGSNNVILLGHSIGGAFASCVATRLHKNQKPVVLITDRSFSRLDVVASGLYRIPQVLCSVALKAAGWDLNPEEAVRDIPTELQHHYFIANDHIINDRSSTKHYEGVNVEELRMGPEPELPPNDVEGYYRFCDEHGDEEVLRRVSEAFAYGLDNANCHNSSISRLQTERHETYWESLKEVITRFGSYHRRAASPSS